MCNVHLGLYVTYDIHSVWNMDPGATARWYNASSFSEKTCLDVLTFISGPRHVKSEVMIAQILENTTLSDMSVLCILYIYDTC